MAHSLLLGMTESGKTSLAKRLASEYRRRGIKVLVLDPLSDPGWPADFITSDSSEFLYVFWRSRQCVAFMDEGGESVGRYDLAMQQTATRGRHAGHCCYFLAQRAVQIAPIVRDMCIHVYLFLSSTKDGATLAEEWNEDRLKDCSLQQRGDYMKASRFAPFSYGNVFTGVHSYGTVDSGRGSGNSDHRERDTGRRKVQPERQASSEEALRLGNSTGEAGEGGGGTSQDLA